MAARISHVMHQDIQQLEFVTSLVHMPAQCAGIFREKMVVTSIIELGIYHMHDVNCIRIKTRLHLQLGDPSCKCL
jgi:hypothetical protein